MFRAAFSGIYLGLTAADNVRRLIIDGVIEDVNSDPFSVVMMYCRTRSDGSPSVCGLMCTGSLIAPNVVLTAAHCTRSTGMPYKDPTLDIDFASTFILMGSSDYDGADWSANSRIVRVKKAVTGGYGENVRNPFDGDVALLELDECVSELPGVIETAKVATRDTEPAGGQCKDMTIVGYGMVSNAPDVINDADGKRRHIQDVLHSYSTCRDAFVAASMGWTTADQGSAPADVVMSVLPETNICTGGASVQSVCYGDSGGPTVADISGSSKKQVIGVTSFGFGAVCTLSPDYATRIAFRAPWIESVLETEYATCPGWSVQDSFASWPLPTWTDLSTEYVSSRCVAGQWQCLSGQCIAAATVCNGASDCSDGSDEKSDYCSYVNAGGARRLSPASNALDDELAALIAAKESKASVNVVHVEKEGVNRFKSAAAMGFTIAGIMKSRALRPKSSGKFWDGSVPASAKGAACSAAAGSVQTQTTLAQQANTIDDQWDPRPLNAACEQLIGCSGDPSSYSDENDFCNKFIEYVVANASLADYANNFGARFNAACPQDVTYPRDGVSPSAADPSGSTTTTVSGAAGLTLLFAVFAHIVL